jgi:nitrite reductase/ring-hydroxylating ferredoxin subunit
LYDGRGRESAIIGRIPRRPAGAASPRSPMQSIATLDEIPDEGLKFSFREGPFDEEGILLRLPDGGVRAYRNECRHLPMPLDDREPGELWDQAGRHLVCNSHGARYRPEDGLCVSGPCEGSHLKELPIEVRDGEVYLDVEKLGSFFDV